MIYTKLKVQYEIYAPIRNANCLFEWPAGHDIRTMAQPKV